MSAEYAPQAAGEDSWVMARVQPEDLNGEHGDQLRVMLATIVERSHGRITVETMVEDINSQAVELYAVVRTSAEGEVWVSSYGALRFIEYPSGRKIMRLDWGVGKMKDAILIMPEMKRMAEQAGVDAIRIEGREGWKAVFPEFHHVSTLLEWEV